MRKKFISYPIIFISKGNILKAQTDVLKYVALKNEI
jgi:hypothetical protein